MNWFTDRDASKMDVHINRSIYSGNSNADGIDLRIEMNRILYGGQGRKPLGHWIVLRRYDLKNTSDTYIEHTKEGVGGPAYEYTDEILRSRRSSIRASREQLAELKSGVIIEDMLLYYFEYHVHPKIGDDIFELEWNDHSIKPSSIPDTRFIERYKIEKVLPHRLENGNIQYYSALCEFNQVMY